MLSAKEMQRIATDGWIRHRLAILAKPREVPVTDDPTIEAPAAGAAEMSMVERVAEAIWSFHGNAPAMGWAHAKSSAEVSHWIEQTYRMARAAIAAMREPTDAMITAGNGGMKMVATDRIWQRMIDRALDEKVN